MQPLNCYLQKRPAAAREGRPVSSCGSSNLIHIRLWSNSSAHRIIVNSTAHQVHQRAIFRPQKLFDKPNNTLCYGVPPKKTSNENTLNDFEKTRPGSRSSRIDRCLPVLSAGGRAFPPRHKSKPLARPVHRARPRPLTGDLSRIRRHRLPARSTLARRTRNPAGRRPWCRPRGHPMCC